MEHEIARITYPMIGETTLPDFRGATNDPAYRIRRSAFNKPHGALDRDFESRGQDMDVIGHMNKFVQPIAVFAPVSVQGS
jgi:hypothetical protein